MYPRKLSANCSRLAKRMKAKLSGFHSQVYTDTKSVSTVRASPLAKAAGPIWITYLAKCAYKKQEVKYRKPFVTDGTLNRNIVPNVFIEQLSSIEYHSEYNSINRAEFYFVGKDTLNGEPITFSNLGHKDVNTLFEVRKWSTQGTSSIPLESETTVHRKNRYGIGTRPGFTYKVEANTIFFFTPKTTDLRPADESGS